MDPTSILLSAVSFCASGMAGTVWYVIRQNNAKIEAERAERIAAAAEDRKLFLDLHERSQAAWTAALEKERDAAREDRHEFRDALQAVAGQLQAYKLEAAEKFVSQVALDKALEPMKDAMARVEAAMGKIFDELKGKADK